MRAIIPFVGLWAASALALPITDKEMLNDPPPPPELMYNVPYESPVVEPPAYNVVTYNGERGGDIIVKMNGKITYDDWIAMEIQKWRDPISKGSPQFFEFMMNSLHYRELQAKASKERLEERSDLTSGYQAIRDEHKEANTLSHLEHKPEFQVFNEILEEGNKRALPVNEKRDEIEAWGWLTDPAISTSGSHDEKSGGLRRIVPAHSANDNHSAGPIALEIDANCDAVNHPDQHTRRSIAVSSAVIVNGSRPILLKVDKNCTAEDLALKYGRPFVPIPINPSKFEVTPATLKITPSKVHGNYQTRSTDDILIPPSGMNKTFTWEHGKEQFTKRSEMPDEIPANDDEPEVASDEAAYAPEDEADLSNDLTTANDEELEVTEKAADDEEQDISASEEFPEGMSLSEDFYTKYKEQFGASEEAQVEEDPASRVPTAEEDEQFRKDSAVYWNRLHHEQCFKGQNLALCKCRHPFKYNFVWDQMRSGKYMYGHPEIADVRERFATVALETCNRMGNQFEDETPACEYTEYVNCEEPAPSATPEEPETDDGPRPHDMMGDELGEFESWPGDGPFNAWDDLSKPRGYE